MAQTIPQSTIEELARAVPTELAPQGLPVYAGHEPEGIEVYRWGALSMRVPLTDPAAERIETEYRWTEPATQDLSKAGISVPTPRFRADPNTEFGRPWILVDAVDGTPLTDVPLVERGRIARDLAVALAALQTEAAAGAPSAPPLEGQREAIAGWDERLRDLVTQASEAGLWEGAPVWCHGRLHPGRLLTSDGRLTGMTGFGGLHGGDPAADYAAFLISFTEQQRADARVILRALGVLTRIVVDLRETSVVELELSSSPARTHGGLLCPTLMPG